MSIVPGHYQITNSQFSKSGFTLSFIGKTTLPLRFAGSSTVHAHDNHGRGDDHQPPGTGCIDWYSVTGALSEADFHGAIILELAGRLEIDQFFSDARRATEIVRVLAEAFLVVPTDFQ